MATIVDRCQFYNHHVYTVTLDGNEITVTVTAASSIVKKWLNTTLFLRRDYLHMNRLVVGLGVQWTPGGPNPPADTVQLSVGRRCLIFQLAHADTVPIVLRKFLLNPNHTFVGFWNHSDRRKLESSVHRLEMSKDPLDLRLGLHVETDDDDEDLSRAKVDEIVKKCLGFEVEQSREIGRSDWDDIHLSDDQVVYACIDAYCAFLLGTHIRAWDR